MRHVIPLYRYGPVNRWLGESGAVFGRTWVAAEADGEVLRIGSEILGYLQAHPDAGDTEEHIARWWLTAQRRESDPEQTGRALAWLSRNGFIERLELPDRRVLYRLRRDGTIPVQ